MREIKFRVWGKGKTFTKDWINDTILLKPNGKWMWEHHHCMHVSPDHPNYKHQFDIDESEFIIELYTGLKDSEGKEIYEGDIVQYVGDTANPGENVPVYKIFWSPLTGGMAFRSGENILTFYENFAKLHTVIGNIHENGNLLKEKKDNEQQT